ncbi:MAG TPA: hypothetical protein VF676_01440 [Flavobacterium sp.]
MIHNYQIRIDDSSALQTFAAKMQDETSRERLIRKVYKEYVKYADGMSGTTTQYQRVFLRNFKQFGIALLHQKSDGSWEKITLADDGTTVVKTPC